MDKTLKGFAYLETCFRENGKRVCLTLADGQELTFGAFWKKAEEFALRLSELGCSPGDRVLIRLENSHHFLLLYLACAIGGYVACPLDLTLPETRLKPILRHLSPKYACETSNLTEWSSPPSIKSKLPARTDDQSDFLIILSSGTTGAPKGIVHSLCSIVESARSFSRLAEHDAHSVVYHHFPMHYMAGVLNLFFCPIVSGSRIVLGPRFSNETMTTFWEAPRRYGVNHLTLTPTMALLLSQLYRTDDALLEHIGHYEGIISTGSMLHDSVAERFFKTFGVPLQSCYGVTEVGGPITLQTWDEAIARESVGRFSKEIDIQCGASAEAPLELRIKTPYMMRGYRSEDALIPGVDADGYFHTGDLGYIRNGRLYITGREHDLIKKGGEFISLIFIEDLAIRHKGVLEAAAVAIPDEFWGNRIILFYVPDQEASLEDMERSLYTLFKENLRSIECPDKIIPVPGMPKTSIGKILKKDLVERYTVYTPAPINKGALLR